MILENDDFKVVRSSGYNYDFNKKTGYFVRWGKTKANEDDPIYSPLGPEILDIEITTICGGPDGHPCAFCYKSNTPKGQNMSFETFVEIFNKLPKTLNQIAFGADAALTANPDIWKMFEYCRNNNHNRVVPNVTVANINEETAKQLASICGAVAVSRYHNKNWCYDSIRYLLDAGQKQVNIHCLLSEETYERALETIDDYHTDPRLKGMNAIVFLSLKQVGRGVKYHQLPVDKFKNIIDLSLEKKVDFGFDSCGAPKFMKAVKDHPKFALFEQFAESCESTAFSCYVDQEGKYYPCSFASEEEFEGIDMLSVNDFIEDVWNNTKTVAFRDKLMASVDCNNCRNCPMFEV